MKKRKIKKVDRKVKKGEIVLIIQIKTEI